MPVESRANGMKNMKNRDWSSNFRISSDCTKSAAGLTWQFARTITTANRSRGIYKKKPMHHARHQLQPHQLRYSAVPLISVTNKSQCCMLCPWQASQNFKWLFLFCLVFCTRSSKNSFMQVVFYQAEASALTISLQCGCKYANFEIFFEKCLLLDLILNQLLLFKLCRTL